MVYRRLRVKTSKPQIEYNNPASHSKADTLSLRPPARSRKHRRARLGELHIGPALVEHEPALGDGAIKAGLVFGSRAPELNKNGPLIFST